MAEPEDEGSKIWAEIGYIKSSLSSAHKRVDDHATKLSDHNERLYAAEKYPRGDDLVRKVLVRIVLWVPAAIVFVFSIIVSSLQILDRWQ